VRAYVDTNVLIRHLTGDPLDQAERATAFLRGADELVLTDLVVAEVCYVLERVYRVPRSTVADALRSLLVMPAVVVADAARLVRSLEVYERDGLHVAEAYLVAAAEQDGPPRVASFDRAIDRVATVDRLEP
jgi:predicted nucleic acid-binding protein